MLAVAVTVAVTVARSVAVTDCEQWCSSLGVVHTNVGQNVTPRNPSLGLFFVPFFTYDELVTSRVNPQQHRQLTNTTTMVMELLTSPAAWIQ